MDNDGSVDLMEITLFFKKYSQDKRISMRLILILLAKSLEIDEKTVAEYFFENGINQEKRMDMADFSKRLSPLLGIQAGQCDQLFLELDFENKGSITALQLIKIIEGYKSTKGDNPFQKRSNVKTNA